jgi:hypothetical protein
MLLFRKLLCRAPELRKKRGVALERSLDRKNL